MGILSKGPPRSGCSTTVSGSNWNVESVGFEGGRKTGEPGEKPSEQGEIEQETQPTYDVGSWIRTQATMVTPASPLFQEAIIFSRAKLEKNCRRS